MAETHQADGGLLATEDLAAHEGQWVAPLRAPYRDVEIAELPPPTQGVTALEALRILDGFPLPDDGPDRHHLLIEATKLALQDRNEYVSDPDAMTVRRRRCSGAGCRTAVRSSTRNAACGGSGRTWAAAYLCASDAEGYRQSHQSNFLSFGRCARARVEINLKYLVRRSPRSGHRQQVGAPKLRCTRSSRDVDAGQLAWCVFGSMGGDSRARSSAAPHVW
jgi:hypothetical protein